MVTCVNLPYAVRKIKQWIYGDDIKFIVWNRKWLHSHKYTSRYLSDAEYRAKISLYTGLFVNVVFGLFKGASGYVYHLAWLFTIGVYYIVLASIRFMLLRNVGADRKSTRLNSSH